MNNVTKGVLRTVGITGIAGAIWLGAPHIANIRMNFTSMENMVNSLAAGTTEILDAFNVYRSQMLALIGTSDSRIIELEEDLALLESEYFDKLDEISGLESDLDQARQDNSENLDKIDELNANLATLRAEADGLRGTIDELRGEVEAGLALAANLTNEINTANQEVADLDGDTQKIYDRTLELYDSATTLDDFDMLIPNVTTPPAPPTIFDWSPTTEYRAGARVRAGGSIWQARWTTVNNHPVTNNISGVWRHIETVS
ncbi:MAG: hypothetical protein FWF59_07435 [Turicibacter sp.]|nr:hypothetical protein [Turicibacter sp.]